MSLESGMDLNKDIETLEQEAEDFKKNCLLILTQRRKCKSQDIRTSEIS